MVEIAYLKGKYDSMEIVSRDKPYHRGTVTKSYIDLSAARETKNYVNWAVKF
jgi:hypothetical protein